MKLPMPAMTKDHRSKNGWHKMELKHTRTYLFTTEGDKSKYGETSAPPEKLSIGQINKLTCPWIQMMLFIGGVSHPTFTS